MDGQEENKRLTLEGLSNILEAQTQRLETLERENAQLRNEVTALRGSHPPRYTDEERTSESSEPEEERMSRRGLLGKAGAAAAGLVVAGALTQRDMRQARADAPKTFTSTSAGTPGVTGENTFGGIGVLGMGLYGVEGHSDGATGQGVHGINSKAGDGVLGDSQGGAAIRGRSFGSTGAGVHGEHFGSGYGGQFKGGKAQLRLVQGSREGRPRGGTHQKGEIYMGSKGALFVCVSGGAPGRWRKVTTMAT